MTDFLSNRDISNQRERQLLKHMQVKQYRDVTHESDILREREHCVICYTLTPLLV